MWKLPILLAAAMCVGILRPADTATATRGRELFQKRCQGCHSLDTAKIGPALRDVFGRRSAAEPAFPYSDALKKARLVWDESTLNRWLADPDALVSDNDMAFRLDSAAERAAIVEYLKQLQVKRSQQR
jgi:cytochrome c